MSVMGWVCVLGVSLVIRELVTLLPYLPEQWWQPTEHVRAIPSGIEIDLRTMWVDFSGIGWVGGWGYLGALLWSPIAVVRATLAWRRGEAGTAGQRILLSTECTLLLVTMALVHLTPLRYPQYNIPLL